MDNSEAMFARCRTAVEEHNLQDRVQLHLADMADFELPRKDYGLVFCALRSFMHLLSAAEQMACLQRVQRHLRSGGLFILDVMFTGIMRKMIMMVRAK